MRTPWPGEDEYVRRPTARATVAAVADHQRATASDAAMALNGMGSFVWELDSGLIHYDDVALAVLGMNPSDHDGGTASFSARVLAQDLPAFQEQIQRALRDSASFSVYFRIRHPDGSLRWTHGQGRVVRDADGRPQRVLGVIRDARAELHALASNRDLDHTRVRQAEMVRTITEALAQAVTVEDVTAALTRPEQLAVMGVHSILVCREHLGRLHLLGASGVPAQAIQDLHFASVTDQMPLAEAVRTRRPRFFTGDEKLLRRYPGLRAKLPDEPRSARAFLPLIAQGTVLGAVGITYAEKEGFLPEEQAVLIALSSTIAQSLQRALRYDQEHELAAELQTGMLPGHLPQPPGLMLAVRYRPASFGHGVGGDWYDAVPLPGAGQRTAVVVGDVQGHDVHAAAVMGQLRTALRAYAAEGHPSSAVMTRASAFLAELNTERFATCLLIVVDTAAGEAEIVRAGHHSPLFRYPDRSCEWVKVPGGLPLGLADTAYPSTRVPLEPGTTLVLCTDGLVEARGADLDVGEGKLVQAVSHGPTRPEPLADHLLQSMAAYTDAEDDIALLVVRRTRAGESGRPRLDERIDPGNPESLHNARVVLRHHLRRWGLDSLGDTAALLACELITNALRYSTGQIILTAMPVRHGGRAVRLEVSDASSTMPRRRAVRDDSSSGRGLLLIEELAQAWGVQPRGEGKCVWAELTAEPA